VGGAINGAKYLVGGGGQGGGVRGEAQAGQLLTNDG